MEANGAALRCHPDDGDRRMPNEKLTHAGDILTTDSTQHRRSASKRGENPRLRGAMPCRSARKIAARMRVFHPS